MMNFIFLAAGMFVLGCDDYIFAGLLPGISDSFQASIEASAQGISIHEITYVGALPICVYLLTKKSARDVLLLALVTFILGTIITLVSTHLSLYIIGRAIVGIGSGLYLPLAIATSKELVRESAKARAMSFAWGANAAGAVVGIPIGLWIAEKTNWRYSVGMILLLSVFSFVGLLTRKLEIKVETPPSLREQARLLIDRGVMSVVGITLLTATAGFGLYVFAAPILDRTPNSASLALALWNVGGLIGSFVIGYVVDRVGKPQWVMAAILVTLLITYLSIPVTREISFVGLLPFLIWGAMGWSTMTPQQHRLSQLKPGHDTTLVALNSSAVSLGGVAGPAIGGVALASGSLLAISLPYLATAIVLFALLWQLVLIRQQHHSQNLLTRDSLTT